MKLKIFNLNILFSRFFERNLRILFYFADVIILSECDLVHLYEAGCKTLLFSIEHCLFL